MLTYWAVKEAGTNRYLPFVKGKNSKAELTSDKPPRLFTSKRAATNAMNQWVKGIQTGHGTWEGDDSNPWSSQCYFCLDSISIRPVPARKQVLVEVVKILLHYEEL